jgi:hypothetical protein
MQRTSRFRDSRLSLYLAIRNAPTILATCVVFFAFLKEGVFLFIAAGMLWRVFTGTAPERPSSATMIRYMLLLFLLGTLMWMVPDTMRRF